MDVVWLMLAFSSFTTLVPYQHQPQRAIQRLGLKPRTGTGPAMCVDPVAGNADRWFFWLYHGRSWPKCINMYQAMYLWMFFGTCWPIGLRCSRFPTVAGVGMIWMEKNPGKTAERTNIQMGDWKIPACKQTYVESPPFVDHYPVASLWGNRTFALPKPMLTCCFFGAAGGSIAQKKSQ